VEDNIACGHRDAAFFFFTSGLIEEGMGRMGFLAANVPEAMRANNVKSPKENLPPGRMTLNFLPLFSCKGNVAFASGLGILIRFHNPPATRSVVENCTVWGTRTGVRILYSDNIHLKNLRLIGSGKNAAEAIQQGSEAIGGTIYENLHVTGWSTGITVSDIVAKSQVIDGGYYDNQVNISLLKTYEGGTDRIDEIKGDIKFGPSSKRDIALFVNYDSFWSRDPNQLFSRHSVVLDTPKYRNRQVYFADQAADAVPLQTVSRGKFRSAATGHVPQELIGKTNREMWQKYHLALAGAVAPTNSVTDPRIDGLIGSRADYLPELNLHNLYSRELRGYRLQVSPIGDGKKSAVQARPVDLRAGWNLVSETIDGQLRSFLVNGGSNRPSYVYKDGPGQPDKKPPQGQGDKGPKPPQGQGDKGPKPPQGQSDKRL
jgi:hypothetical protein